MIKISKCKKRPKKWKKLKKQKKLEKCKNIKIKIAKVKKAKKNEKSNFVTKLKPQFSWRLITEKKELKKWNKKLIEPDKETILCVKKRKSAEFDCIASLCRNLFKKISNEALFQSYFWCSNFTVFQS